MHKKREQLITLLNRAMVVNISETNGLSVADTLELMMHSKMIKDNPLVGKSIGEFNHLLGLFQIDEVDIETLLRHPVTEAFFNFFKNFPLPYCEEHIHLTGSLSADFIFPRLKKLLGGPNKKIYEEKIAEVYGQDALPIENIEDVENLIVLKEGEQFGRYLEILYLAKLILTDKNAHCDAAYHMASTLFHRYNVGFIRLKFTLSRATAIESEQIPGSEDLSEEDVVMGLYEGFKKFQKENNQFNFILSPCFRKELDFFDKKNFKSKEEHFLFQVDRLLEITKKHPQLKEHLVEIDTVGDEKELFRKAHFNELKSGLRKLQYNGFRIRSHHGETWKNLKKGVQSVDNAMNIWHIDTLEHGLSLGINPNFYFHRLYQKVMEWNNREQGIPLDGLEWRELVDMNWHDPHILEKLKHGEKLTEDESISFIKTKFHTAREVEHYQHDVLNRMITKKVSLMALPTSNLKLTGSFPDFKDHPFSWWEKKGVQLGVGTDNYVTLGTNFIQEMLILLYSNSQTLKITKLLMVCTKEERRPYISHLLWEMRKKYLAP